MFHFQLFTNYNVIVRINLFAFKLGNKTVPPDDETTSDNELLTSSMIASSMKRESLYNGSLCRAKQWRKVNWTATLSDSTAILPCPNNIDCRFCVYVCVCMPACCVSVRMSA